MTQDGSRHLVRRAHEVAVASGNARSTQTVGFDAEVFGWSSLPLETRTLAKHDARVVADHAGADDAPSFSPEGAVDVLRAWRAHRDRIYVAVAARPSALGSGRPGPWRHVELQQYDVDAEPRRRVGWVPAGVAAQDAGGAGGSGPVRLTEPSRGPHERSAANAWPFLPAAVRDGAARAVPVPDDWLGQLTQRRGADGLARSQEIVVLRRDERTGLVVRATRQLEPLPGVGAGQQDRALARADWLVEQVTYSLRARRLLGRSRPDDGAWWR